LKNKGKSGFAVSNGGYVFIVIRSTIPIRTLDIYNVRFSSENGDEEKHGMLFENERL